MYLSLIIPFYNEEENLPLLIDRLNQLLPSIGKSTEIIFIDDGSADNSFEVLKNLVKNQKHLQHLLLRKINIKPMPEIRFKIDIGLERAAEVEKALLRAEKIEKKEGNL